MGETKDELFIQKKMVLAGALGLEPFRCPSTGQILDGVRGDDKVLCNCSTAVNGTHMKYALEKVGMRDYVVDYISRHKVG